jgi:hemoglobin
MKKRLSIVTRAATTALSILFLLALLLLNFTADAQEKPISLYQRLGGYDALVAVVDDWVGRMANDPLFTKFRTGFSLDSMKRRRQLIVDYICQGTGGPCFYTGRTVKVGHTGLGITRGEWNAAVKHLASALDKFKVPQKEKDEVLTMISGLKTDIVEKSDN